MEIAYHTWGVDTGVTLAVGDGFAAGEAEADGFAAGEAETDGLLDYIKHT